MYERQRGQLARFPTSHSLSFVAPFTHFCLFIHSLLSSFFSADFLAPYCYFSFTSALSLFLFCSTAFIYRPCSIPSPCPSLSPFLSLPLHSIPSPLFPFICPCIPFALLSAFIFPFCPCISSPLISIYLSLNLFACLAFLLFFSLSIPMLSFSHSRPLVLPRLRNVFSFSSSSSSPSVFFLPSFLRFVLPFPCY